MLALDRSDYLHFITPFLLLIPFLTLLPAPRAADPELPGIRPITIRTVTPRRSFILLTLVLLTLTGVYDTILLIVQIATASHRGAHYDAARLAAWVVYALGALVIWGLTTIVVEWRARWGDKALVVMGMLGLVCEIPNLVFKVIMEIHARGSSKTFAILALPPSALRLLLLPILIVLVSTPRIEFKPADETTGLLSQDQAGQNGEPSRGRQATAYGTFEGGGDAGSSSSTKKPSSRNSSTAPPTPAPGAQTPAPGQQIVKIPKKLGEVKKDDKPLTWREIGGRLRKLSPHLWPSTSRKLQLFVLICVVCLLIARVGNPLIPIALGQTVRALTGAAQGQTDQNPLIPFAAYLGLRFTLGGNGILGFTQNVLWVPVAQYTDKEMQLLCFNHLLNLSLAYHTKRNTGEVLKVIDRGSAINNLFQTIVFTLIPTIIDIIVAFGVFFYLYGALLAFAVIAIMIVYIFFSVTHTNWRMKNRRQMVERDVKARGIVSDVLTNWESVKYFTAEDRETHRYTEAILSYQEAERKVSIGFNLLSLIQFFLITLGLTIGSLIIAFRILHQQADAAEFVVFIQYYAQMQGPLDRFSWLYRILNQETTDAEKMFTLLAQATEVNDKPGAKDLVVTDGIIEFDDVRFSYDGKVEALKGVSFKIGKGESMALVGESGSGKSTILRLLYRFYDITSGHIYIDGQDISDVTQLSLRRAIGIVPQDSVLWNDTIGANVSYGKEGADDDEIIVAAKAAKLHDRILTFPEGYSTIVGERGVRLSGGEKQRVSLARMFLKSPAILVLDEATSALDTETEREIQRALAELAKGRSSLSIAHRLSTIINSDQIVVMKEGQVIENGTYKDLLDLNGSFATMWKKQIFTEAEMVAQAQGVSPEDVAKTLPAENDLIDLVEESKAAPEAEIQDSAASKAVDDRTARGTVAGAAAPAEKAVDMESEAKGFSVDGAPATSAPAASDAAPSTYAEAVKSEPAETSDTHPAESESKPKPSEAEPEATETTPLIDSDAQAKGDDGPAPSPAPAVTASADASSVPAPSPAKTATTTDSPSQVDSTGPATPSGASASASASASGAATPTPQSKRASVTFPSSRPGLPTSTSQRSDLSLPDSESAEGAADKDGKDVKRRKRLSSIKGFVRRISDQGVTRSGSINRPGSSGAAGAGSPLSEDPGRVGDSPSSAGLEPGQGEDKKKKRLSLGRNKSDKV
ncbi:Heavy metal tolerance protein [Saitozyma sp. JCM 24511]|nr:Heavy metal tolerance protein [Saitozyma sp. JCM 24511]